MKWEDFILSAGGFPVIETRVLSALFPNLSSFTVHVSRWEKAGKLIQVRRGIYLLSEPYRRIEVWEPHLAALLKRPSYLSLHKALEYHGCIPEAVPMYTSVTPRRQATFTSPVGVFSYRHISPSLMWGYEGVTLRGQTAFIAHPEKALLDLIYLERRKITRDYIRELRLQNVEKIDTSLLGEYARRFRNPRMTDAGKMIGEEAGTIRAGEKTL